MPNYLIIMLQVMVSNVRDVFFTFFKNISMHISLIFLSLGSAEAEIWRSKKLNGHLMASRVRNIHTINYENLIIFGSC